MKHLITYGCLNEGHKYSKLYTQKVRQHWNRFDGKRVCVLSSIGDKGKGYEILSSLDWDEFYEIENTGGEAEAFINYLLPSIEYETGNAFYAHSKGVTHDPEMGMTRWINTLWDDNMRFELEDLDFHGIHYKPTHSAVTSIRGDHYPGTFYWMNPRVLKYPYLEFYNKIKDLPAGGVDRFPWRKTKTQGYYFTEIFPGLVSDETQLGVFPCGPY